jgi:hypothetical protein
MQAFVHIKPCGSFEHVIDGSRQFVRQDGPRFALALLGFQSGQILLPCRIMAEEQRGRFGKGLLEVGVAAFLARGALAFARGCPGVCDDATVRDAILPPMEAMNILNVIKQHQG